MGPAELAASHRSTTALAFSVISVWTENVFENYRVIQRPTCGSTAVGRETAVSKTRHCCLRARIQFDKAVTSRYERRRWTPRDKAATPARRSRRTKAVRCRWPAHSARASVPMYARNAGADFLRPRPRRPPAPRPRASRAGPAGTRPGRYCERTKHSWVKVGRGRWNATAPARWG